MRSREAWLKMHDAFKKKLVPGTLRLVALTQKQIGGFFSRMARAVKNAGRAALQKQAAEPVGGEQSSEGEEGSSSDEGEEESSSGSESDGSGNGSGSDVDDESDNEPPAVDYNKLKVKELKEMLRGGGLKVGGTKPQLIARLKKAEC